MVGALIFSVIGCAAGGVDLEVRSTPQLGLEPWAEAAEPPSSGFSSRMGLEGRFAFRPARGIPRHLSKKREVVDRKRGEAVLRHDPRGARSRWYAWRLRTSRLR